MKHFFTAIAMLAMSLCASAEGYRSVAVNLADGSKVEINLADKLSASFDDENFIITGGTQDVTVPRADIKSFTFSTQEISGVDEVGADTAAPVISDGKMSFSDLPAASVVTVYNPAGALLLSEKAEGDYSLELSKLPAGTVIVKVNNVVFKIATR